MEEYHKLVNTVAQDGVYKPNRTALDTISFFGYSYTIDLSEGYPLITTKDLSGFRWNSLVHEFLWYLSGDEHIRNLREHTSIWDAWADEDGNLDTAYGRFWRRYPQPKAKHQFSGENWPETPSECAWMNEDGTVDQLQYVIEMLNTNPFSRRMVVSAWHPTNATTSTLPPCHFTYVFNVSGDGKLNVHLTQRSGDIALGVPFNIAAYAMLAQVIANQTGYEIGEFSHTIVDAHIYCGDEERGEWYGENLSDVQKILKEESPASAIEFIEENAPTNNEDNKDHLPNLLRQIQRDSRERPTLTVNSSATIDTISRDDIELSNYDPHESLGFYVAE